MQFVLLITESERHYRALIQQRHGNLYDDDDDNDNNVSLK